LLEVDPREISSANAQAGQDSWIVHLFDSSAGGSGHIASLLNDEKLWMQSAISLLRGDSDHHLKCGDACLGCLLDAQSQSDFESGMLDRSLTLEYLEEQANNH
jgi:hypothetical protein